MVTFPLVFDGLYVQGGEAEMFGAGFGGAVKFRGEDPLVGPLEDGAVGGRGAVVVVLAGDVEGEVEEGLSAGFKEGGEAVDDQLELSLLLIDCNIKVMGTWQSIRNVICFFEPIETLIQVPVAVRILTEVVDDIAEPAHPC